jgi:hypothetical protein
MASVARFLQWSFKALSLRLRERFLQPSVPALSLPWLQPLSLCPSSHGAHPPVLYPSHCTPHLVSLRNIPKLHFLTPMWRKFLAPHPACKEILIPPTAIMYQRLRRQIRKHMSIRGRSTNQVPVLGSKLPRLRSGLRQHNVQWRRRERHARLCRRLL